MFRDVCYFVAALFFGLGVGLMVLASPRPPRKESQGWEFDDKGPVRTGREVARRCQEVGMTHHEARVILDRIHRQERVTTGSTAGHLAPVYLRLLQCQELEAMAFDTAYGEEAKRHRLPTVLSRGPRS